MCLDTAAVVVQYRRTAIDTDERDETACRSLGVLSSGTIDNLGSGSSEIAYLVLFFFVVSTLDSAVRLRLDPDGGIVEPRNRYNCDLITFVVCSSRL